MIKEKQQLGFYESNFVNILPYCRITKNGGQEVTWNVINQSNMLEMMRVNINFLKKKKKKEKKRKEKAFMKEVKILQPKTTLHLTTLLQLYPVQVRSKIPQK